MSASMNGDIKDELILNLESAPVDGLETSTSTSDMMQMVENNLGGLSGILFCTNYTKYIYASLKHGLSDHV